MLGGFDRIVITKQQEEAVNHLLHNLLAGENCSMICMRDVGKRLIYLRTIEKVKKSLPKGTQLAEAIAVEDEDLHDILETARNTKVPTLLVINSSMSKDISWFIEELDVIANKRPDKVVIGLLVTLQECYEAYRKGIKILTQSAYISKPVNYGQAKVMLTNLETMFQLSLTENQRKEIHKWAGGHFGTMKAIFMMVKDEGLSSFDKAKLLDHNHVTARLDAILEQLPIKLVGRMFNNELSDRERKFLEKFGFLTNGKIFSPLLAEYVVHSGYLNKLRFWDKLDFLEKKVFTYLVKREGKFIPRDELKNVLLQESTADLINDWDVDRLVINISEKAKETGLNYYVEHKRGFGVLVRRRDAF